ncbi:M48 family metallopeptidase [Tissierella creatinophila]|uniref:Protease HtpX n=1 Tax=Tissierella creatinophila DSM 6911 TaxID=1123403 RepID=A0A1U7M6Y4_TISCR|nr:M48 family metallopeptidase [Tissierella creatinophila]OLS03094.1 hypothetical protein TICRE_07900 [Tissierella creatinophila DSM 6911]
MDIRLKKTIIIFFVLLLIFISLMIFSEYRNIENLREEEGVNESALELRKESLKVWGVRLLLNFLIPLLFLTTKFSQKISSFVSKGRGSIVSGILYGLIFFFIVFLINLPLNFYSSYYLNHKYGLSNQSIWRWLELNIKSFLTSDLLTALFLWVPYGIISRGSRTWWIKLSLLVIPVIIFMVFISPLVIDPIFNKYTSIADEDLGKEITTLLDRAGIKDAKIYKVDKSKDTKTMNAYMTGISSSKRIVLWDTTIEKLNEKEILSVTSHEIGHYINGHIWKNILLSILGTFILFFLVYIGSEWMLYYSYGSFGFKTLSNYASLPLLILLLNVFLFFGDPLSNYISRKMEVEADIVEITLTGDRESAVSAMEKLSKNNLGVKRTSKLYEIFYLTHPSLEDRIEFYKTYPID